MPPLTYPTFAAELLHARRTLTVADEVGLALRAHRHGLGTSQRAYARLRGWSKGHGARLEAAAGRLRLDDVTEALRGTGLVLALCRDPSEDPPHQPAPAAGRPTSGPAPGPAPGPVPVRPEDWPRSELVARVRDGSRRFPGHHTAEQVTYPPGWWWASEATTAGSRAPHWTARRPWDGQQGPDGASRGSERGRTGPTPSVDEPRDVA